MPAKPERRSRAEMTAGTTARLIAVARDVFAKDGFSAASLDSISTEAGVTRGALHHHFTNKSGLFEAVLRAVVAEIDSDIESEWDREPDRWLGFCGAFATYLDAALLPTRRRILFQDAYAVLGARAYDIMMGEGLSSMIEELRTLGATGSIRTRDAEATAHMLNGAVMELAFWAAEGTPDENRLSRAHLSIADTLAALRVRTVG